MHFDSFLIRSQWLTKHEYLHLAWRAIKSMSGNTSGTTDLLSPSIDETRELNQIRPLPFGDVLALTDNAETEIRQHVLHRSGCANIGELVSRWQKWHAREVEPISDYSLATSFGRRLYHNDHEKRICARFIADSRSFGADSLVHDADHVIVPEGTSAFYVGLAIASCRRNIVLVTSNGALIRELNENSELARGISDIMVIGGELDPDVSNGGSASRGFLGKDTEHYFDQAIEQKPGVTVVICSVNGLLPRVGPYAPSTPKAGSTRYALLKKAFECNVRQVVFVADHSKLLNGRRHEYGDPIFSRPQEWQSIVEENQSRISFVIAAPPELQQVPELAAQAPRNRATHGNAGPLSTVAVREYLQTAKGLDELSCGGGFSSRLFELGGQIEITNSNSTQEVVTGQS